MSANADDVLFEVRDGLGFVTFNRPDRHNALTIDMYRRLGDLVENQPAVAGVKALVLQGAGDRAFAAGTDISTFLELRSAPAVRAYEETVEESLLALENCPVPTVAAIRGVCTGGGAAIAAVCDVRIGSPSQRFGIPIARTLGNCLSDVNYARFAAIVGAARLKELIFTARLADAEESLRIGWLHYLADEDEGVLSYATDVAARIASHAPLTLRATKTALKRIRPDGDPEDSGLLECYLSRDFHEGVMAFLEKRPAVWIGE